VTEYNSIVYKYHVFLIHSSVVRHLECFHSLAIMNYAAINMGVQVPYCGLTYIPSGIALEVELMYYTIVLFFPQWLY
jgi:hypothetical protein